MLCGVVVKHQTNDLAIMGSISSWFTMKWLLLGTRN